MRVFLLLSISLIVSFRGVFAQPLWEQDLKEGANFYDIMNAFTKHHPDLTHLKDGDDKRFMRWARFMAPRVYPTGKAFNPQIVYDELVKYHEKNQKTLYKTSNTLNPDWKYSGPKLRPSGNDGGTGRVNFITFHPKNPDIQFVGTPSGSLWKSTDGGKTFKPLTDNLSVIGCTELVINPRNPDSMFLATGDGFGYPISTTNFWGGTYSAGILVSADGGNTWKTTGLSRITADGWQVFSLRMHPTNPNFLIATTNNGIYKSTDGAKSFTLVQTGSFKDIEFHPSDPSILYASSNGIYVSTNSGNIFLRVTVSGGVTTNHIALAVTPAKPDNVYAVMTNGNIAHFYRSTNKGVSWVKTGQNGLTTFTSWYYLPLSVDPKDENIMYSGSINTVKSTNHGVNWNLMTVDRPSQFYPFIHADHRSITFYPGSSDTIYSCSDGGLYVSYNKGQTWNRIAEDIQALQLYRIGSHPTNPNFFFSGTQDNGMNRAKDGAWSHVIYGDGMEAIVDYSDPNVVYGSTQNGSMYKSIDGGLSFSNRINPSSGNWTTPFVQSYKDPRTLYFGGARLWRSRNAGGGWDNTFATSLPSGNNIHKISLNAVDEKKYYVLQASEFSPGPIRLFRTDNDAVSWTLINTGLPLGTNFPSDVKCDKYRPDTVYLTLGGFTSSNKVYRSYDGGASWTNITGTLPNVPVNCVEYEYSDKNGVYIGTDIGVFYRNDDLTDWIPFQTNLPNVVVFEIETFPALATVRAATFGRGVWDSRMASTPVGIERNDAFTKSLHIYPNPSVTGVFQVNHPFSMDLQYQVSDVSGKVLSSEILSVGQNQINMDSYPKGTYLIRFSVDGMQTVKKVMIR